jgi:hypothetical protein
MGTVMDLAGRVWRGEVTTDDHHPWTPVVAISVPAEFEGIDALARIDQIRENRLWRRSRSSSISDDPTLLHVGPLRPSAWAGPSRSRPCPSCCLPTPPCAL